MSIDDIKKEVLGQKPFFILYLDDEPDLHYAVEILAEDSGLIPLVTTHPEEALEWVRKHRSDIAVIISDLKMPVMDGFTFRSKILEFAPEIPFAVLSAHVDTATALKGIETKIFAFIPKPCDNEKIAEVIFNETITRIRTLKEDRELRAGFVSEAESLISESEDLVLAIEKDPTNDDSLNRFFGVVHTIKGASSFFEPKTLHQFAHKYEDLLKKLQRKELEFSEPTIQILFQGFDILKATPFG